MKQLYRAAALAGAASAALCFAGCSAPASVAAAPPVYVHMNGRNEFLEPFVVVQPGQPVVFVNEDTGVHSIVGYNPQTGAIERRIDGAVAGTPGPGHRVSTYRVRLKKIGAYAYYCSVHATLVKTFGHAVQPAPRKGVHGFGGAMGGWIVVTDDPALYRANPPTTAHRLLPGFFGG